MLCSAALAQLTRDRAATYRITVRGRLDGGWSEHFGCIAIYPIVIDERTVVTTLIATFRDQAELLGVLNRLCNLGLPLYRVDCLAPGFSASVRCGE